MKIRVLLIFKFSFGRKLSSQYDLCHVEFILSLGILARQAAWHHIKQLSREVDYPGM